MADDEILNSATPVAEAAAEAPQPARKTRKPAKEIAIKSKTSLGKDKTKESALAEVTPKRRRYSEAERAEKVAAIDAGIAKGTTLKASAKSAGVTEQSYYQWKKVAQAPAPTLPSSDSIVFADLLDLEAENRRLRAQLADKLRAENEELRKRIGKS